jgi:hypothetical protein
MNESIQLTDPLFKLTVRFSNGETVQHFLPDMLDANKIENDTRYMVISSYSCEKPSQCTDTALVSLRDVSYIKSERVTLEQLTAERRMAGIRGAVSSGDDRLPKTLSQVKFL